MVHGSRVVALARQALAAGDLNLAAELIAGLGDEAAPRHRAEALRVRAQLALAGASIGSGLGTASVRDLVADAELLSTDEQLLAGLTLADAAEVVLYRLEPHEAIRLLQRAGELVAQDPAARRRVSVLTGAAYTFIGRSEEGLALLTAAIQPVADTAGALESVQALHMVIPALGSVERYEAAVSVSQRAVAAVRRTGAVGPLPMLLCGLANSAYFTGDYDTVVFAASEALDLAEVTEQPAVVVFASACLALAHAVRGSAEDVARHAAHVRSLVPTAGRDGFLGTVLVAEGILALGAGAAERAAEIYDTLSCDLGDAGRATGVLQWSADYVEAMYGVGRVEDARRELAELESAIGAADLPWSQSVAARCRGLLAGEDWRLHLADAVARWPAGLSRFELGRTHLLWAQRAHAAGRIPEGREQSAIARACFIDAAAPQWVARAELLAATLGRGGVAITPPEPASSEPAVELRAFGPLTLVVGNVEHLLPLDRSGLLLRLLVAQAGVVSAEQAVETLWPDLPTGVGAARLRSLLTRMRRQWGDVVVRDGAVLRWGHGLVVDVAQFEIEAASALREDGSDGLAMARRAVARYRGEVLPMSRGEDWSTVLRERTRHSYVRLLRFIADVGERAGDIDDAVHQLERAIEADRYEEAHYLRAAEILLAAGRPGAARRFLDRADAVATDLGTAPSEDANRLRQAVLRSG